MNARALRVASAVVAAVGLGIAAYLTAAHYDGGSPVCAIAHGCATVQQSEYAELAGVPVALLGLAGYTTILVTLLRDDEPARTATAFLALAGAGFSAWLTYVEVFTLDAICIWCVGSAVCMVLLAALSAARVLIWHGPRAAVAVDFDHARDRRPAADLAGRWSGTAPDGRREETG